MTKPYWQRILPSWPVVPMSLWLTGAGAGLAVLNLIFRQEIWPAHPQAEHWTRAILLGLMLAGGVQVIYVLWRWLQTYAGPNWLRLALRIGVAAACIGIAILLLLLLVLSCIEVLNPVGLMPDQD